MNRYRVVVKRVVLPDKNIIAITKNLVNLPDSDRTQAGDDIAVNVLSGSCSGYIKSSCGSSSVSISISASSNSSSSD